LNRPEDNEGTIVQLPSCVDNFQ